MPWTEFVANSYFALQIATQHVTMSDLYVIKTAISETRPSPLFWSFRPQKMAVTSLISEGWKSHRNNNRKSDLDSVNME